jgi:hypothetical protein
MKPPISLRRHALLSVLVLALIVACDRSTEPKLAAHVTSVDTLRPGQIAHVRGSGLTSLQSLRLDGVAATELVIISDSVAEFRVPSMRACETDMRAAQVTADDSEPIDGVVRVPPSISLSVAESRVLTASDLQCLRLPAEDEDYVLSAANTTLPTAEMEVQRPLVSVHVLGTAGGASMPASYNAGAARAHLDVGNPGALVEPAMYGPSAAPSGYSPSPTPFDPKYATAVVGDTLRFVDWFSGAAQICEQPAESVPSFKAKVVAVAGQVVVVADLRQPAAAAFENQATLGWLRDAAAKADQLLLPAMRSLFAPDYTPLTGGGGRFWVMLGNIPGLPGFGGFAYDGPLGTANIFPQSSCPRSSEMIVSTVNAQLLSAPQNQGVGSVAGLLLHEYAHSADFITSGRGKTSSILNEGLATLAEETASRIASAQPVNARHASVSSDAPALTGGALGMWGTSSALGPWQFNGRYGANARMLLFLRELAGESSVDHGRTPTLYQRLIYNPIDWLNRPAVIGLITSVLGIDYVELTDRFALASVTAGLIDPGVAHTLPRFTAWDHSERAKISGPLSATFAGRASRRVDGNYSLGAADGGHAALYLMADGARGISLELLSIAQESRMIRLTRLR